MHHLMNDIILITRDSKQTIFAEYMRKKLEMIPEVYLLEVSNNHISVKNTILNQQRSKTAICVRKGKKQNGSHNQL